MPESLLRWDLTMAFVILGLGAWMTVNGVYQELPIISQTAPEGYDIFSYVVVALALANVAPATYLYIRSRAIARASTSPCCSMVQERPSSLALDSPLLSNSQEAAAEEHGGRVAAPPIPSGVSTMDSVSPTLRSRLQRSGVVSFFSTGVDEAAPSCGSSSSVDDKFHDSTSEYPTAAPVTDNAAISLARRKAATEARWLKIDDLAAVVVVGGVGVVSCVGLAFSWQSTAGTSTSSVGLLSFTLLGGCVDCLTSVFFYPLAGHFPPVYMSVLLAGEACTGLLASLLATAQATSTDPSAPLRFSVAIYFLCLAGIMACAAVALLYLQRLKPPTVPMPLLGESSSSEALECAVREGGAAGNHDGEVLDTAKTAATSPLLTRNRSGGGSNSSHSASGSTGIGGADNRRTIDKCDEGMRINDGKCHEAVRTTGTSDGFSCDAQGRAWAALLSGHCSFATTPSNIHISAGASSDSEANFQTRRRSWTLRLEQWLTEQWFIGSPAGRLFLAQAILAVIENGLHTTLAPAALGAVSGNSPELQGRLVSIALKVAAAGATLAAATAHALQPPLLFTTRRMLTAGTEKHAAAADADNNEFTGARTVNPSSTSRNLFPEQEEVPVASSVAGSDGGSRATRAVDIAGRRGAILIPELTLNSAGVLIWGGLSFTVLITSVFIVVAARVDAVMEENGNDFDDNSVDDGGDTNEGANSGAIFVAVFAVVLCKVSVAFTKASLFVAFHPSSSASAAAAAAAVSSADGVNEAITPQVGESASSSRICHSSNASSSSNSPAMLETDGATILSSARQPYQGLGIEQTTKVSARADECLRWGGAGIQAGSLVGASVFFVLTVVWRVL